MRSLSFLVALALAVTVAASVTSQDRVVPAPSGAAHAPKQPASPAQTTMDNAAKSGKFVFVFFYKEKNAQADRVWKALQSGLSKYPDTAKCVALQTTNPAEKPIVDRYNVSKAPMPLILAVAPCGAVTKAYPGTLDEKQLAAAFVSPCEQLCMKAIQSRKLVFVCVVYESSPDGKAAIPQGVKEFQGDKKYAKATEVVLLNAKDKKEADFLKELKIDAKTQKPVSVLVAPPGALIGAFDASATKQQIVAKLASAQSGCCPGGKCGPGGCCPKK
jgi:hypothetical protein